MNQVIARALIGYFETLYDFNRNLIMLCGVDIIDNSGQYESKAVEIIQAIPRLVPYGRKKGSKALSIFHKDGLLEFSDDIIFLNNDYELVLKHHYEFLSKVKTIRNKIEHKMHSARLVGGGSISDMVAFDLTYVVDDEEIPLFAREIISFAKEINCLFSKIQTLVEDYAKKQGKENHRYYRRLIRYDFCDFNKVYTSGILHIIGKFLYPF